MLLDDRICTAPVKGADTPDVESTAFADAVAAATSNTADIESQMTAVRTKRTKILSEKGRSVNFSRIVAYVP